MPLHDWRHLVASEHGPSSPTTRHVLLTLSLYMSVKGDSCFPSVDTLTTDTGCSRRSVIKHLKIAREDGWLEVTRHGFDGRRWARNEYRTSIPKAVQEMHHPNDIKAVQEVHHVGDKAVHVVPQGGASDDIKAVQEVHPNKPYNNSKKLPSPAREADDPLCFLDDDARSTYGPQIQDVLNRYSETSADVAYRNILPRRHHGTAPPIPWMLERIKSHGWEMLVAALIITADQADSPSQKYADRVLDTLSKPKHERIKPGAPLEHTSINNFN